MKMEKIAVEVHLNQLLEWANNKSQWQAIVASESYQKQTKEAWEWLLKNSTLRLMPFMNEEQFAGELKNALTAAFASELFNRCIAGVENWESTTVDEEWLKAKMHKERESAALAVNQVIAERKAQRLFAIIG